MLRDKLFGTRRAAFEGELLKQYQGRLLYYDEKFLQLAQARLLKLLPSDASEREIELAALAIDCAYVKWDSSKYDYENNQDSIFWVKGYMDSAESREARELCALLADLSLSLTAGTNVDKHHVLADVCFRALHLPYFEGPAWAAVDELRNDILARSGTIAKAGIGSRMVNMIIDAIKPRIPEDCIGYLAEAFGWMTSRELRVGLLVFDSGFTNIRVAAKAVSKIRDCCDALIMHDFHGCKLTAWELAKLSTDEVVAHVGLPDPANYLVFIVERAYDSGTNSEDDNPKIKLTY